jgi:AraC-like DNA-binding protein
MYVCALIAAPNEQGLCRLVMTSPTNHEPKTILSWAKSIAMALEMEGVNSRELFEKAGIPYQSTADPSHRIESRKITRLFKLAVEATGNPCFGLKPIVYMHPATFHALGYSLYASSTLYDFCQRLTRFFRLLSDNALHHLYEDEDAYRLVIEVTNPELAIESQDGWVGCIVFICRSIYRPDFNPLRIELTRPKPESHAEDFQRFFKTPIIFSAKEITICFDKKDMHVQLPAASTELALRNDEVAMEHLARLDRNDIVRQVEAKIVELLPTGECSKERISSQLNISLRNLHNKLEKKGTSYQEILEDLRSGLALQYIKQDNMSISEITYLLGFSDTSNFSRAFKRWTGVSPSQYRKNGVERISEA